MQILQKDLEGQVIGCLCLPDVFMKETAKAVIDTLNQSMGPSVTDSWFELSPETRLYALTEEDIQERMDDMVEEGMDDRIRSLRGELYGRVEDILESADALEDDLKKIKEDMHSVLEEPDLILVEDEDLASARENLEALRKNARNILN